MPLPILALLAATGGAAALGSRYVMPWIEEANRKRNQGIREGLLQNVDPNDPYAQGQALMRGGLLDEDAWFNELGARERTILGEQGAMDRTLVGEQGLNDRFAKGQEIDWARLALEGRQEDRLGSQFDTEQERLRDQFNRQHGLDVDRFGLDVDRFELEGTESGRLGSQFDRQHALDWTRLGLDNGYVPQTGPLVSDDFTRQSVVELPDDVRKVVELTDAMLDLTDRFTADLTAFDETSPLTFPGSAGARQKATLRANLERTANEIINREATRQNDGREPTADQLASVRQSMGFPDDFNDMWPGQLNAVQRSIQAYRDDMLRAREGAVGRNDQPGVSEVDEGGTVPGETLTPAPGPQSNYRGGRGGGSLLASESGGRWNATNSEGMAGRAQFSPARLAEARQALGVNFTTAEFLRSEPLQRAAERWHFNDIGQFIMASGLDQKVGQRVKGVPITLKGMLFAAHLGGKHGMKRHIESGGRYDPADSNGTRLSDYLAMGARETYG